MAKTPKGKALRQELRRNLPSSLVIPADLKMAALRAADHDRRSLSNLVVVALEEYLTRRGYYPERDQVDLPPRDE